MMETGTSSGDRERKRKIGKKVMISGADEHGRQREARRVTKKV